MRDVHSICIFSLDEQQLQYIFEDQDFGHESVDILVTLVVALGLEKSGMEEGDGEFVGWCLHCN